MNLIVCIHGIVGGKAGKDGTGGNLPLDMMYEHFKNRIIDSNKGDFKSIKTFIHSWSVEEKEKILSLYNPDDSFIENSLPFKNVPHKDKRRFSKSC